MIKRILLTATLAMLTCHTAAIAGNDHPVIDIEKMPRSEIFIGPYSYFVPPYSTYYYHHMDELGFRQDWVRRGKRVYELKEAVKPFTLTYQYNGNTYTLDDYLQHNQVLGFLVLKDNQIIAERYTSGANVNSRFLSNSMQKSFISTLVGIALEEGKLHSLDDKVIEYLPELSGSGFNRVTIRQLLTMSSAIDTDENYQNSDSGIYPFADALIHGTERLSTLLSHLAAKSDVQPGDVFDYESVNSQVLGLVLEKATGVPLNQYMQAKIWQKIGAQDDAFMFRSRKQEDQCAFGCLSANLRDYGRYALAMMNNGSFNDHRIVSSAWVQDATRSHIDVIRNKKIEQGYGYHWWVPGNNHVGIFAALGVFGQIMFIDPVHHIVIIETSAWPANYSQDKWNEMYTVLQAVTQAVK